MLSLVEGAVDLEGARSRRILGNDTRGRVGEVADGKVALGAPAGTVEAVLGVGEGAVNPRSVLGDGTPDGSDTRKAGTGVTKPSRKGSETSIDGGSVRAWFGFQAKIAQEFVTGTIVTYTRRSQEAGSHVGFSTSRTHYF